jgi:hypothetical protein
MKKLGKLSISPEKIMKNEDLINLQGGYGGGECDAQAAQCGGPCTIEIGGQTSSGTCERRADLWNLCACVEN